jgi:antitoxin CcdA
MAKKHLEDPARPFRHEAEPSHSGHIGRRAPGPKRAVNLSVDAEILKVAKEMKLNLSQALEDTLRRATKQERARRFYEENKASFDAYNAMIERDGTLAEAYYGKDAFDDPSV